jgi:ribosome recycling factor
MDAIRVIDQAKNKFQQIVDHFVEEIKVIRTGRANASMLDNILVEVYGTKMPIIQTATVNVLDAQMLQVNPFDPNNIDSISSAIRSNQALSLNPSDDGHVIRVAIPPLNEERRKEIAKQINQKTEEALIKMRAVRHDSLNELNKLKKDKLIGEDENKRLTKLIDEQLNSFKGEVELLAKNKEKDIMSI